MQLFEPMENINNWKAQHSTCTFAYVNTATFRHSKNPVKKAANNCDKMTTLLIIVAKVNSYKYA